MARSSFTPLFHSFPRFLVHFFTLTYFNILPIPLLLETRSFLVKLCQKPVRSGHFVKLFFAAIQQFNKNEWFCGHFRQKSTKSKNPAFTHIKDLHQFSVAKNKNLRHFSHHKNKDLHSLNGVKNTDYRPRSTRR